VIRPRLALEDSQAFEHAAASLHEAAADIIDPRLRGYLAIMADAIVSEWYEPDPLYTVDVSCLGTVPHPTRRRSECDAMRSLS
jgi:hypothetical protein